MAYSDNTRPISHEAAEAAVKNKNRSGYVIAYAVRDAMSTDDLFNELQRRLEVESMPRLAERVDELHWKYQFKKEA